MGRGKATISELLKRTQRRAEELGAFLWNEVVYGNDLGRGRSTLLTQEQKDRIIQMVTSSRNNREKESRQAIAHGKYDEIVPRMSITIFENVMYEAGYARRKPGWKPELTREQEEDAMNGRSFTTQTDMKNTTTRGFISTRQCLLTRL